MQVNNPVRGKKRHVQPANEKKLSLRSVRVCGETNSQQKESRLIDVEQYWRDKEAALGEKIGGKFNCKYLGGYADIPGPLSGLIFFSESFFCFHSFFSPGFLASLLRSREPLKTQQEHFFCEPLETAIFEFEPQRNNLWNKLFAPMEEIFTVRLAKEENPSGIAACRFKAMRHDVKLIRDHAKITLD